MSKVDRLRDAYSQFIGIPWRQDVAAAQRVIFCIYNENDELRLRAKIEEFELVTRSRGHDWLLFDLTNTFPDWLSGQRYAEKYYQQPDLIKTLLDTGYLEYIHKQFEACLAEKNAAANCVVAIHGVGTLFGLIKVKQIVDKLAPLVTGRLVVFFPGSYDNNNYRLLDGYDGWNYLAVPITADKEK